MEEWLASVGLERHAGAFRAHGIARDDVPDLSDEELRELGLSIGDRRRLRRAALGEPRRDGAWVTRAAERRPLTMLFVDVVGSSRLSDILPSEDLMELLRQYAEFCAGPIERYGGRISRMVGDGLLAYFCHPVANENDPERAVRAALDITRFLGDAVQVPGGEPLAVRIGIATGPVVVGDLRTASRLYPDTVVGFAPNLAARLQALAPPGGIVIAEETHARVRDRFDCVSMGSLDLRGMAPARTAFQVLREADASGVTARARASALCGREAELAALEEAWARAADGHGLVVLVAGEPGIGKSRLVEAFLERTGPAPDRTIQIVGAALDMDSPLRPVAALLQRMAGPASDGVTARLERLRGALAAWREAEPALAYLVGGDGVPKPPDAGTADALRETTLQGLVALVLAETRRGPLRVVVEDLHWCDPTTLELVARLGAALANHPVLLIATARESYDAAGALGWQTPPAHVRRLVLRPLDEADVATLAHAMLPEQAISPGILRLISRKAGGVPLFVEEVVRTLVARDGLASGEVDEAEQIIPASTHELLAGRLDRLGEDKEIAQAAAVLGREVRHDVLARVCATQFGTSPERLRNGLGALARAGLLVELRGGAPTSAFTHGLLQDAAYTSLVRERRQALHLASARAIQACAVELVASQPELVARHFWEGGDPAASLPYWLAAGQASLARSSLLEGTRLLQRGVAALDQLPRTPDYQARRLEIMALLGPALMALHGPGEPGVVEHYAAAKSVAEALPHSERHFPIYWGWWRVSRDCFVRLARAQDLVRRAEALGDPELVLQAHHCGWASEFHHGKFARCCEHIHAGLALYDQHETGHQLYLYGNHDAKVCGHGELSIAEWVMGRPLSARRQDALSQDWARQLGHLGSLAHNLEIRLDRQVGCREVAAVRRTALELKALAVDHRMGDALHKAQIFLGWAQAMEGEREAGLRLLSESLARQRDIGTSEDFPVYVALEAEALCAAGQPERAAQTLHDADLEFTRLGLRFWQPEVRRLRAEATLACDGRAGMDAARLLLAEAVDMAREQGAVMLALRAQVRLAELEPTSPAIAGVLACLDAIAEDDCGADLTAARALLARHGVRSMLAEAHVAGR